jgi:putative tryptophan/tyrosine transport system substrate-binding protein
MGAMRDKMRIAYALPGALILLGSGAALGGSGTAEDPFEIFMILYRGETEVEDGFKAYLEDRGIHADLTVRSVDSKMDLLPEFVTEAKEARPDLVYTWGTGVTLGTVGEFDEVDPERHITDIPVVFTMVSSPEGARIVPDRDSSGRNLTGVSHIVPLETQIRAMRAYRRMNRLAVLYNPNEENSVVNVRELKELGQRMGFTLIDQPVPLDASGQPDPSTLPKISADVASREPQFLYIGPDTFIGVYRDLITAEAIDLDLPTFTATELEIRHSNAMIGLVSPYFNVGRFTAFKAEQILVDGKAPAEIPIETLSRFSYLVKMPVVQQVGLYPPMAVLDYAEIIE